MKKLKAPIQIKFSGGGENNVKKTNNNTFVSTPPSSAPSIQNQINSLKKLINDQINEYKAQKSDNANKSKKKNNRKKITDLFAIINRIQVPNPWNESSKNDVKKNELKKYTRPKRQEILSNFQKKYPLNNHITNFDLDNFTLGMQLVKEGEKLYYEAASEKDPKRKETLYNAAFDLFEESYKRYNNPVACEYISRYYSKRTNEEFRHNKKYYNIVRIKSWVKDIVSKIPKNEEISKNYLIKVMQILRTIPNKNNLFDSFGINYSSFSDEIKHELYFVHHVSEGTYNSFKLNI